MGRAGLTKKVLAVMIHLSLAIHCTESSSATPVFSILTGSASEALPETPGQVQITLSDTYRPPEGYEVRYRVSDHAGGDPGTASPIAPGETQLTDAVFTGTAYVKLYLVRSTDGAVVQQTELPAVRILQASMAPRLSDVIAAANGATAARASVTSDTGSGILHWVATTSEIAPEASGIVAGQDHAGAMAPSFGSVPVEPENPTKVAISGLMPGKTYHLHFVQRTAEGIFSDVASSASVTPIATVITDVTNPVVEDIFTDAPLRTAWQGVTPDDYAADNEATITHVAATYRIGGEPVESGEIHGNDGDVLTIAVDVTASDGTAARFVYGPATISAAPVVDQTPPVLSDFSVSASGPGVLSGSVTTTESGGSLYWAGADVSGITDETVLLAQVEAQDLSWAETSGSGPVAEAGAVPVEFSDLSPDRSYAFYCCHVDGAGNRSNIVKASARTLPSDKLTLTIEDFSRDKVPFHSRRPQEAEASAAVTKEGVLALADDPSVGSQHEGAYRIPGQDKLPAGVSLSGSSVIVSGSFTGWLEGWDFTGYQLAWRGGEVRLRNSILGERDGPAGLNAYLDIYPAATIVEIAHNDILGPNGYGGAALALKYRTAGDGAAATGPRLAPGRVARNRFLGLSSDAIKPTGGILEENVILYQNNLDGPALPWSPAKTYAQGELARNSGDNVFRSRSDGNAGNPVPSQKSDTTHWESLDPHSDAINPAAVTDPLTIRSNHVDMDADPERSVGMNNAIRSVPNTNSTLPHGRVDVTNNVLIGATGGKSKLIQATDNGNPNHVPDRFYNNWVKARSQGDVLHTVQAAGTVWENNRDLDTDAAIPGTPETVSAPALAETAAAPLYLAQVPRSGTATPGRAVEGRAVPQDGGEPTEWVEIATADGEGRWSGTLDVPRGPHPYRFEVRLKDDPSVSAGTTRTFMSGVLIAMHTQSDIASPALKTGTPWVTIDPEPLLEDGLVQMFYLDGFTMDAPEQPEANLKRAFLSNETPYSPGMAAMANTFIDLMPDTPVAFIMHTVSGTSPTEMANDGDAGRDWNNDRKLHEFVVRDGNRPGLHASYFSSSYTGIATNFGEALAPIFTGRQVSGAPFETPGAQSYGYSRSLWIDHTYADLYDLDFTRTMILPIEAMEDSFRADFLNNPAFEGLFAEGKFDLYNSSVNGRYNATHNRMDDSNHANSHKEWGGPRRMRMWALSVIEALGEEPLEQPLLDIVEAAPNGDAGLVRIGSSEGPVTTIRKQLGMAELDASKYPAYGDVYGIYVNGSYVDAYIGDEAGNPAKEGWIYVPKPSGPFESSDVIGTRSTGFGRDQVSKPASGAPSSVDYYLDDALLSKPVVPSAIHRVWGLHAIMPKEAGDTFLYSDIVSGRWGGRVPTAIEPDRGDTEVVVEESEVISAPAAPSEPAPGADYVANFSTDLSSLVTASSGAILRHRPGATWSFPRNGSLTGALELTGSGFHKTHFSFTPEIRLGANQGFELDLAAYASSLPDQTSAMSIRLYCDHDGGTDLLSEVLPNVGVSPGTVLADLKGQRFTCKGANGRPRIEFVIDNPRNDKRRISLMRVAIRAL